MEEHDLELVKVSDPTLRRSLSVIVRRAVELVQVGPLAEATNGPQRFLDVRTGDMRRVSNAGMEDYAAGRPMHRLAGRGAIEPECGRLTDEQLDAEIAIEICARPTNDQLPSTEQPGVVEPRVAP